MSLSPSPTPGLQPSFATVTSSPPSGRAPSGPESSGSGKPDHPGLPDPVGQEGPSGLTSPAEGPESGPSAPRSSVANVGSAAAGPQRVPPSPTELTVEGFRTQCLGGKPLAVQPCPPNGTFALRTWWLFVAWVKLSVLLVCFFASCAYGVFRLAVLRHPAATGHHSNYHFRLLVEYLFGYMTSTHLHPLALDTLSPTSGTFKTRVEQSLRLGHSWPSFIPGNSGPAPCVLVANHQSVFDVTEIPLLLPPDIYPVAKKELKQLPFFGSLWSRSGGYFIDRQNRKSAIELIQDMSTKLLEVQRPFFFFPRGPATGAIRHRAPQEGAFHLAINTKTLVLPTIVTSNLWLSPSPRIIPADPWYRRATGNVLPITYVMLRPISTKALSPGDDLNHLVRRVWQLIQISFEALDRLTAVVTRPFRGSVTTGSSIRSPTSIRTSSGPQPTLTWTSLRSPPRSGHGPNLVSISSTLGTS